MIGNRQTTSHHFAPSFGINLDGGTVTQPDEMPASCEAQCSPTLAHVASGVRCWLKVFRPANEDLCLAIACGCWLAASCHRRLASGF